MSGKKAIIDCGTNTFHLLIVDIKSDLSYDVAHVEKAVVNIGRGGINDQVITAEAEKRAVNAISGFSEIINKEQITDIRASATSAFRNAHNGPAIRDNIKKTTGILIEIIDGETEAELIYNGVNMAMDIGEDKSLIMDIGGGSIEFIIGNANQINWSRSYEIGAQRLLDLFHENDPISRQEITRLNDYLADQLPSLLKELNQYNPKTLIGSSGTFDTLSDIYSYSNGEEKDNAAALSLESYDKIHRQLIAKTRKERLAIPGMVEMRVNMIVVASCVIDFVLGHSSIENIRVSTFALKEGVLSNILKEEEEKNNTNY